jgi:hypothetical protein
MWGSARFAELATSFMLFFSWLTLKMEATCSSETSVNFHRATWRYIPEDRTLHNHRCENHRPYIASLRVKFKLQCFALSLMDYTV